MEILKNRRIGSFFLKYNIHKEVRYAIKQSFRLLIAIRIEASRIINDAYAARAKKGL